MSSILKTFKMATLESSILRSKFRGCLLGSLIGDCTGAPYEGDTLTSGDKIILQKYFDKLEEPNFKAPFKPYTDDTAMMKSVAKFLIDKPEPNYTFLAKLFVSEYFKQPKRGYGQTVVDVFHKLKNSKFEDVFKPAKEQFFGSGSYGNGGAMRIAPIALYCHNNYKNMLEIASNATKLTHTNILGVNGALLQCIAIQQALECHPQDKIDPKEFCRELYQKMEKIENTEDEEEDVDEWDLTAKPFQEKLRVVEHLLGRSKDDMDEEVIFCLGNGINSYDSVPTAIYCFLRAQSEISHVKTDNIFRRTIQYAISLGGDTDTIACMAGAIAGAYLGEEAVNCDLARHCEFSAEIVEVADNLFLAREGSSLKE